MTGAGGASAVSGKALACLRLCLGDDSTSGECPVSWLIGFYGAAAEAPACLDWFRGVAWMGSVVLELGGWEPAQPMDSLINTDWSIMQRRI